MTINTIRLTTAAWFWRNRRRASDQRLRPATSSAVIEEAMSRAVTSALRASVVADSRIKEAIEEVRYEVAGDDDDAKENRNAHHERVVAVERPQHEVAADAGNAEDLPDDDRAGDDVGDRRPQIRDNGQDRCPDRMARESGPFPQALGPGRPHVVAAQRFDHAAAHQARYGRHVR